MTVGLRRPWAAVDFEELVRSFPPPPEYFDTLFLADPAQLDRIKLSRAQHRVRQAARVPFFARLWSERKVGPDTLQSIDDLWKFPAYDVEDIRRDIEENPPFGTYQGVGTELTLREPQRLYFSGGTTGKVRPTLYTQWDREVSALFMARALYRQGVRPGDVVLNSYQYSTFNGGALFDEAAHHWLNCVVISTSSGNVTPSEKQAQLAADYAATCIMTTGDHLIRIIEVARELGYDPLVDFNIRAVSGLGDRKSPEEIQAILAAVGVPEFYDSYGFHEIGLLGVECPEHDGVHIFEEAYEVQCVDPDTGEQVPDGHLGSMVVTEFFKTGSPQIRYNTRDLSWLYPREQCRCGSWMRRIGSFSGRADNMVKLRGINVWPEAIGLAATDLGSVEADYFVRARRVDGRDDMLVSVVSREDPSRFGEIAGQVEHALQQRFGLKFTAEVVPPGSLDELTEVRTAPKPKRFRDERPIAAEPSPTRGGPDMEYEDLLFEVKSSVATITINRADRLNALRQSSLVEMADAIETANREDSVGVIVITGAGERAFSAGGDLDTVQSDPQQGWSPLGSTEVIRWVNAFRQSRVPIIAKVRGYCIGLGNELNLLCDLTVAAQSAQFGQAGPRVGSVPLVGGTQMLPLVSGLKRAKEVLYLCRRYSGQAAVDMGLANVVVADDELDAEVERWTAELLEKSPQSLRIAKLSLSYLFDLQWASLQHGVELTGWMVASDEMKEGARAFMEKRPPRFRQPPRGSEESES